jgi:hypothetical protein
MSERDDSRGLDVRIYADMGYVHRVLRLGYLIGLMILTQEGTLT